MTYPDDTAAIRPEERFDEARVAAYLGANVPELADAEAITFAQFPGGHANLTYLARADDAEFVLRRPPLGPVAPKSHDMVREHTVLARLWQAYPEAPRAIHLCTDESIMGKPFFVMERKSGFVIRDAWPEGLPDTAEVRSNVADTLIDSFVRLHLVDYTELGLSDLGRPDGFVERQVSGWRDRWERAMTREIPAMDALLQHLGEEIPDPQRASLIHNDFRLDNAMVDRSGNVVSVFDWDMATLGDPLADFATTYVYWAEPEDPVDDVFLETPMHDGGFPTRAEFADQYAAGTGLDLSDFGWYEGFAFFKVSVILEQIYMRYQAGQTSDERFAAFGDRAARIAEAGLERVTE